VGALVYGPGSLRVEIDDYMLAHLQCVIVSKLRRRESFLVTVTAPRSRLRHSIWLNDAIPLVFDYDSMESPALDRDQIDAMMIEAVGARGLRVDSWESERRELSIVE
jgi:hypothetical protein